MQSFHFVIKVKGGRGASSSSPTTRLLEATRDSRKVRAQTPWGKGCTEVRCTPQAARRGGYACLTNIPLSIPGLYIITYKWVNSYHFCGPISPSRQKSSIIDLTTLFIKVPRSTKWDH